MKQTTQNSPGSVENDRGDVFRQLFWLLLSVGVICGVTVWWLRRKPDAVEPERALPPEKAPESTIAPHKPVVAATPSPEVSRQPNLADAVPVEAVIEAESESAADTAASHAEPIDDLTKIEGIGPKISGWLNDAGITLYQQLAQLTPEQINETLRNAGHRMAATDTWPEQAALAAAGRWDELAQLQDTLHGGRRR